MEYLRSQPEYDGRAFSLFYSLAALAVGQEHAIVDDPLAQIGKSAQQVIDNCNMLAECGVTTPGSARHRWTTSMPTSTICSGWRRRSSPRSDERSRESHRIRCGTPRLA